jgi:hypothetical protein
VTATAQTAVVDAGADVRSDWRPYVNKKRV